MDYEPLRNLLAQLCSEEGGNLAALVERLIQAPENGAIKLYLTRAALRFRCQERELFAKGRYLPLRAIGDKHRHVVAYARSHGGRQILVMAGRLFAQLGADHRLPVGEETWGDTTIMLRRQFATKTYRDIFTGQTVAVGSRKNHQVLQLSEVFSRLPLAVLIPEDGEVHAG